MSSELKYRSDIDGLRAIAVSIVVFFHAFPSKLKGGYVGVDVFFVISGYLITTIILKQLSEKRFSFKSFYIKRINRIFPTLFLVLVTSYFTGYFALLTSEFQELAKHIASGAGFVSNIVLWKESGYFDTASDLKPLLHLWSLSIEEQFYIFWPLILFFCAKKKINIFAVIIGLALFSFILNTSYIHSHAVGTFYLLPTRFWELLLGSILAYVSLFPLNVNEALSNRLSLLLPRFIYKNSESHNSYDVTPNIKALLGILLIIIAAMSFKNTLAFPGYRALFPTIGCMLIISAGPQSWFNKKILSFRPMILIGLISYPLYLWHWPILSFLKIFNNGSTLSTGLRISAVLLSFLLAWLTYIGIEKPIRKYFNNSIPLSLFLTGMLILVGLSGFYTYKKPPIIRNRAITLVEQERASISQPVHTNESCPKDDDFKVFGYCSLSEPEKPATVALIGDSHAAMLFFGLTSSLHGSKHNLILLGNSGCIPFWDLESTTTGSIDDCKTRMNFALDYVINSKSIKQIILSSRGPLYITGEGFGDIDKQNRFIRYPNDSSKNDLGQIFTSAMFNTLRKLHASGKKVLFVMDVPELGFSPAECLEPRPLSFGGKKRYPCTLSKNNFKKRNARYHTIVTNVLKSFPAVKVFNANRSFCDDEYCYATKDGKFLYWDDDHLSEAGAEIVGKGIVEEFLKP